MDRAQLVESLQSQMENWEDALSKVKPQTVGLEGVEGYYSVKDLLAHVMENTRWIAAQIKGVISGTPPTSMELYGQGEEPTLESFHFEHVNRWIYERYRDTPYDSILADYRTVWSGLIEALAVANDEILDQAAPWPGGPTIRVVLKGVAEHSQGHLNSLKQWRHSVRRRSELRKPTIEEALAPRGAAGDDRPPRKYSWSETMTPGFNRTLEIASRLIRAGDWILDVPCGKAEAMARIARAAPVNAVGVDYSKHLLELAKEKMASSKVTRDCRLILADGGRLPFADETFQLCLSVGGPSCIGGHSIEEALREQTRITAAGGSVVISDIFRDPSYPNPWIDEDHPSDRGWWELLESVGLRVISFEHFPVTAWDEYHAPMRELVATVRQSFPDDQAKMQWADEVDKEIAIDRPEGDFAFYGAFVARKP